MSNSAASTFNYVQQWHGRLSEGGWWHSFDLPDGRQIQGVCSLAGLRDRIGRFDIPQDLRGKRVLDIGCWDGWFTFEMERRGAEVMAVDCWDNPRFREIHAVLNSKTDYRQLDVYELTPDRIGRFDIVLFMGVLYHLKHPLLALERVCALTTDFAAVDSFVLTDTHLAGAGTLPRPILEFYETTEFGGQSDNWVGPNIPCLLAMCRTAGFARVHLAAELDFSACVLCHRHWELPSGPDTSPAVVRAQHHTNFGQNFQSRYDEYVSLWFEAREENLTLDDVKPAVGGFGVRPISLSRVSGGLWQANFKLPPLPGPGWYDVTLRLRESFPGPSTRIAVDLPLDGFPITIHGVFDGLSFEPGVLHLDAGNAVSIWVKGLPEHADLPSLRAFLDGRPIKVQFMGEYTGSDDARQINAEIPPHARGVDGEVHIAFGDRQTTPLPLRIV